MKNPIPDEKNPVQTAIENLQKHIADGTMPPPSVIVAHPASMDEIARAIADMKKAPIYVGSPSGQVTYMGQPLGAGDVQKTLLELQLESSLWQRATMHTPVFTREDLTKHVGPGHMEGTWYVKRINGDEVLLLCKCEVILVLMRCMAVDHLSPCEEPAFPVEGAFRKDTRCGRHASQ